MSHYVYPNAEAAVTRAKQLAAAERAQVGVYKLTKTHLFKPKAGA